MITDNQTLFEWYAKLKPHTNVELELRAPVVYKFLGNSPTNVVIGTSELKITKISNYTMYYYMSPIEPTCVYRTTCHPNSSVYEKKSELAHFTYKNTAKIALSIESKYSENEILYPLSIIGSTYITKYWLDTDPPTELVIRSNQTQTASLEIEFEPELWQKVLNLYNTVLQTIPLWPVPAKYRPMQVDLQTLARKVSSGMFMIAAKADGIHVHIYTTILSRTNREIIAIDDEGVIRYTNTITPLECIRTLAHQHDLVVLEGEYISDNKIYVFDMLLGDTTNYTASNIMLYPKRLEIAKSLCSIPLILKPVHTLSTPSDFELALKHIQIPETDGYIISNIYTYTEKFKLKYINTVDAMYSTNTGLFYTATNQLVPASLHTYTGAPLHPGGIYEIDLDSARIIKHRTDKSEPNAVIPAYCPPNPYAILSKSIGVPFTRMYNNRLKHKLLTALHVSNRSLPLIDIGSGKLGDMNKWMHIGFSAVYAIDPILDMQRYYDSYARTVIDPWSPCTINRIYGYNTTPSVIQTLNLRSEYVLAILFVPWSPEFIPHIQNAHKTALILMDNPQTVHTHAYTVDSSPSNTTLKIAESQTATNISEPRISISQIMQDLGPKYTYEKVNTPIPHLIPPIECTLISMYSAYLISKCD